MPSRSIWIEAASFFGWLIACFAAAAVGAAASVNAGSFYATLVRPTWAPPGWLFGPVWSVLYASMAVAIWLVRRASPDHATAVVALGLFVAQLAFNALWSWLFFAWRLGGWAFAEIVLLWLLIAATIIVFGRIRPVAAWLLVPYLLWVSFASLLNWTLWKANPGILG